MPKTTAVLHDPDDSLDDFYKKLCEAFWAFTSFDPETTENQRMINSAFEGQAQVDMWKKKITEVKRFAGKNATELLCQQSLSQSQPNSKKCMRQKVALLAAALSKHAPPRDHTARQGAQIRKRQFPSVMIIVPIARKRDTGKMCAPVALGRKPK